MAVRERRRIEAGNDVCQSLPKERYAMTTNKSMLNFPHPDEIDNPRTSVLRDGARRLLAQAVETEAEAFLATMADERLADGGARVVRHGHGPEHMLHTGIGAVPVKRAKLHDRGVKASGNDRITLASAILPKLARRTKCLDALLPVPYLRGISADDF
jgi:hypothetical protein